MSCYSLQAIFLRANWDTSQCCKLEPWRTAKVAMRSRLAYNHCRLNPDAKVTFLIESRLYELVTYSAEYMFMHGPRACESIRTSLLRIMPGCKATGSDAPPDNDENPCGPSCTFKKAPIPWPVPCK